MTFSEAIEALKKGKKIARIGWNGKGQYVDLGKNIHYTDSEGEHISPAALVFHGVHSLQVGWLASQADILAEDWCIRE